MSQFGHKKSHGGLNGSWQNSSHLVSFNHNNYFCRYKKVSKHFFLRYLDSNASKLEFLVPNPIYPLVIMWGRNKILKVIICRKINFSISNIFWTTILKRTILKKNINHFGQPMLNEPKPKQFIVANMIYIVSYLVGFC